ncbi:MAG: malto-oligosyltrehalose synthase [Frankiales bacterium]|nr:malto-oligosyltrehalose synthase [Frankiales bacterium]
MPHLPASGRPVPVSTYRVQLHAGFTFDDAAAAVPYLADLGATHLYCSPYQQAAPGSMHGYDVVAHDRLNSELGGQEAFDRMVAACRAAGLGIVLDIVPNHVATSEPESQNEAWWGLLRDGRDGPYGSWFDVDWDSPDNPGKVLVPVLGAPLGECLEQLELLEDRIRYYDHEVPIAPGTRVDGDVLATLEAQHYRLCHWRVAAEELNYRRFFDVTTLAGVRVEEPAVFDATHALVVQQVRDGVLDGLRIDHPDGLADPEGYLARLAEQTGGSWVVVEKILEPGEELPDSWATAGTTGYDALNRVLGLFVDPAGEQPLTDLWTSETGSDLTYLETVDATKHLVLDRVLTAEVERLVEVGLRACRTDPTLRDTTRRGLREALVEVLAAFDVYRAYLPPEGPADDTAREQVEHAAAGARATRPDRADEIDLVVRLALAEGPQGPASREFVTRFQQTCGPVMAKGVEDTAFYRYLRLSALNEVGGDPGVFGLPVQEFHEACVAQQRDWPLSMTTLSTHDTKRSEDVRARLVLLSQCPQEWGAWVVRAVAAVARHRGDTGPDRATEQLVLQTLVGAWPLTADRAVAYVEKATREAKASTSWVDPVPEFDEQTQAFVRAVVADPDVVALVEELVERLDAPWRQTLLAQKLVQLTMPGVADVYQGTELPDLSLVDPDNRRPVDYDARRAGLAALAEADPKLRLVAAALRLRRDRPEAFLADATYEGLDAGDRAVAFARSGAVVTVACTRAIAVQRDGWGDDVVALPGGTWRDLLGGGDHTGSARLADVLADRGAALLVQV